MALKSLIRSITPRVLLDFARSYRQDRTRNWEGIYAHYRDVPVSGDGFESQEWLQTVQRHAENVIQASALKGQLPVIAGENALLPLLAAAVGQESGRVQVLDFGGGLGHGFVHLRSSLADGAGIDYHIVDTARTCQAGAALFAGDARVHFHPALPAELTGVDIVYIGSTLQYIEDYSGLLRALCAYRPAWFLFANLSAGYIPTFATGQKNMPKSVVAYWFINLDEIVSLMADNGYALKVKFGSERTYRQDNFSKPYRIQHTCNVLFARRARA